MVVFACIFSTTLSRKDEGIMISRRIEEAERLETGTEAYTSLLCLVIQAISQDSCMTSALINCLLRINA